MLSENVSSDEMTPDSLIPFTRNIQTGGLALHQHETNVVTPGLETGRMAMRWYHSWRVGFRISQQLASHL